MKTIKTTALTIQKMDLQSILAGLQQQGGAGGAGGAGDAAATNVQFRAGTMKRVGRTVTADKEKGHVRVYKDANQLTHFTWKERTKQDTKLDLMLFPGDAEIFPLPRPPATGRCFALRLKEPNRIHFFWMQEPSEDKDAKLYEDINKLLGNTTQPSASAAPASVSAPAVAPAADDDLDGLNDDDAAALQAALALSMQDDEPDAPTAAPQTPAAAPPAPPAGDDEEDAALQAALAMSMQMDVDEAEGDVAPSSAADDQHMEGDDDEEAAALQAALAMSMGEEPPAAPAPAAPAAPGMNAAQMEMMRNLIAGIKVPGQGGNVSAGSSQQGLDLASVLDAEQISTAVLDPEVQQRLMEHLPEELRSAHEISELVRSPQFQQALDGISHALSGPQMYQVLQSMGIDPSAAPQPGLEGFYGALMAHAASQAAPAAAPPAAEEAPDSDSDLYD